MVPAVALSRTGIALAVGAKLALVYGFLQPLRRKSNWFWDLVFLCVVFYGWLYVGFGVCGGDQSVFVDFQVINEMTAFLFVLEIPVKKLSFRFVAAGKKRGERSE